MCSTITKEELLIWEKQLFSLNSELEHKRLEIERKLLLLQQMEQSLSKSSQNPTPVSQQNTVNHSPSCSNESGQSRVSNEQNCFINHPNEPITPVIMPPQPKSSLYAPKTIQYQQQQPNGFGIASTNRKPQQSPNVHYKQSMIKTLPKQSQQPFSNDLGFVEIFPTNVSKQITTTNEQNKFHDPTIVRSEHIPSTTIHPIIVQPEIQSISPNSLHKEQKKLRFSVLGQPLCSYPGCNKTTSSNPDDFRCCVVCKIAFCTIHQHEIEIIVPNFQNHTSVDQVIKPFALCKECKNERSFLSPKTQIGVVSNYWNDFITRRNSVVNPLKLDDEIVQTGVSLLVEKKQNNSFSKKKESGCNTECPVCNVVMNSNDNGKSLCEICNRNCCIGCSISTTIAPTLIMGIKDPKAEYVHVVLCKKCYASTLKLTKVTQRETKKDGQMLANLHQRYQYETSLLISANNSLEETIEKLQDSQSLSECEKAETHYVSSLNQITRTIGHFKSIEQTSEGDHQKIITNLIVACCDVIHSCSLKHAQIFRRYQDKLLRLGLK
ncbi:FYVE-type domain-containing protein [Entamoeba marina]